MPSLMKSFLLFFALGTVSIAYANVSNATASNSLQYKDELKALNGFLEDFDDGFYGYIEVADNYIIIRFKEGNYSKFRLEDMAAPVVYEKWGQLNWDCKDENHCVETDWNENGKETGILFSQLGFDDWDYFLELLHKFIDAYRGK